MYEVWFIDCCGHSSLEKSFDSYDEAKLYVSKSDDFLSYEEAYIICVQGEEIIGWD